jgi:hypothetical protein
MKKYDPVGSDRCLQKINAGLAGNAFQADFDSLEQQVGAYKFDDVRQISNQLGKNLEGPRIT